MHPNCTKRTNRDISTISVPCDRHRCLSENCGNVVVEDAQDEWCEEYRCHFVFDDSSKCKDFVLGCDEESLVSSNGLSICYCETHVCHWYPLCGGEGEVLEIDDENPRELRGECWRHQDGTFAGVKSNENRRNKCNCQIAPAFNNLTNKNVKV